MQKPDEGSIVPKALAFIAVLTIALTSRFPVDARARLIAIFPIRCTPTLASRAQHVTKSLAIRLAATDGYDTIIEPDPQSGTLGNAAAAAGAEIYVVGQIVQTNAELILKVGSFAAATDAPISKLTTAIAADDTLPPEPNPSTLLTASAAAFTSLPVPGTLVPAGTPIALTVDTPISSASAKVGDSFAFKAAADVAIDGVIVVRKGSEGKGEIAIAQPAGSNGHPGKLGLQFDWIADVSGSKVALSDTQRSEDGEAKKGAASTATIATYVLLGPLGLFAHNFVHGRDITIDETVKLKAYVDHSVHVVSAIGETTPDGFAK